MDTNYSKNLEIEVNFKKGLIISNEKEDKRTLDEEEEFWDYEDGGQTMEELDRLEKLEIIYPTLLSVYRRFKNIYISKLLNRWRNMPYDIIIQRKNDLINIKYDVKDIQEQAEQINIENIIINNPIRKDIEYPLIIKDIKLEDKSDLINKKPKKKYDKINIMNDLILSENNVDIYSSDYSLKDNKLNLYKNLIPNLITLKHELSPVKIQRKGKTIEIETSSEENFYKNEKPNKPIKRVINCDKNKIIKKDEIIDDINYIKHQLEEKINEKQRLKIFDKFVEQENQKDIKNIDIKKDYLLEISDKINQKPEEKLNILNVDYQLNLPTNINLRKKLRAKNRNIKNKNKLRNKLEDFKIINLSLEEKDEIIFEQFIPNKPIKKNNITPIVSKDIINANSDEIKKRPKKRLDKINSIDNINISDNLEIISTDYNDKINIKQNKNIPEIINNFYVDLPLIKIKKKRIININDDLINEDIPNSGNKDISFSQIRPNNIIKRNINPVSMQRDEYNNIESIKNLKIKNNKININDKILIKDININIREENNQIYEYKIPFDKNKFIPEIIKKDKETSLKPLVIDIFNFKDKLLSNENPKEIIDNVKIEKNYIILKYDSKKYETKNEILSIIENNYLLSKINTDKIRYNYRNIIEKETILNNKIMSTEDEIINSKNENFLNLPKRLDKYTLNQIPEKIKEENKINLNDNMDTITTIQLKETKYILNEEKNKIVIPKINLNSFILNPIEIKKQFNKFLVKEKPKEIKPYDIKSNYFLEKYSNTKKLNNLQLINNDYRIFLPEYIKRTSKYNNRIENENIIGNKNILKEEESLHKLVQPSKVLNLPNVNKLNLIQKPEKIPKIINIPNISEEINIEQLKLNKHYTRLKLENINIYKDKKFEDNDELRKNQKKIINKININDEIQISDKIKIHESQYEINEKYNKLNNLIPKILLNPQHQLVAIKLELKLKLQKFNVIEKPTEKIYLTNIKNDCINIKYINKNIKKKADLKLLNNNYQLSEINTNIRKNYKNIIDNENIIKSGIILVEEENINKSNNLNKLFNLPKVNELNLIQKPEKIIIPKIINIPNISEEINIEQLKSNNPHKRKIENLNIKDEKYNDLKDIKNKQKKIHNKLNINDKFFLSDDIKKINEQFEIQNIINNKLIPKIVSTKQINLNPIPISLKLKFEKHNLLEKSNENKQIQIKNDYLNIKYNTNDIKDNLSLLNSNYQLSKINVDKRSQNFKNIISNENIIKNDLTYLFLKEEDNIKDYHNLIKFVNPKDIKLNIIQNPEKIIKSKLIEIPNKVDEINIEQIRPNKTIKRKINIETIDKDIIFEDLDEIKKKQKKQLNKINISDSIQEVDNKIQLQNENYVFKNNKNKEKDLIPNIIPIKQEINLIKIPKKINIEKYNLVEKLNEKKDMTINIDYLYKNKEYKTSQESKLSILDNNYQLNEISCQDISKSNKLRGRKPLSKEFINIIENEKINSNNILQEDKIKEEYNKEKLQFNLCPIINKSLNQKPDNISKETKEQNEMDEIKNEKTDMNNQIKEMNKNDIKNISIKNEKNNLNKNLLDDFEKDEEKKKNPNSTEFKFYDSKNKLISKFNFSSFIQNDTNSIEQKQFFNFMHKKFLAFKLFKLKNSQDPRKKWFYIWKKKTKE